ncbi:hypothetical protein CMI41_04075 [Candidatus Pacearchaeota archaeon]|nr:hypothetical protein [Candidatus Pacearchaeota archaeon]|tara:strand:+ start:10938 stop:11642 length:705 start_codon:yes stop_codon:yes gene_type:complete
MALDDLLNGFEGVALAKQAREKGPQAEVAYIAQTAREAPNADPAVINSFGYLLSEENTETREAIMQQISGRYETQFYGNLEANLAEVLGDIGRKEHLSLGMKYSNEAAGLRTRMSVLENEDVDAAYRTLLLETPEGASEEEEFNIALYNSIVSGFDTAGVMTAFKGVTEREQKEYLEHNFYSTSEECPVPHYDAEKAVDYLAGVFSDGDKLSSASMELGGLYHKKHRAPEGSEE